MQRLKRVPTFVSNVVEVLKEGERKNMTLSAPSLTRSEAQFDKLLAQSPEETSFFELFKNLNETFPGHQFANELMNKALEIIGEDIQPVFQELKDYVFTEYINHLIYLLIKVKIGRNTTNLFNKF